MGRHHRQPQHRPRTIKPIRLISLIRLISPIRPISLISLIRPIRPISPISLITQLKNQHPMDAPQPFLPKKGNYKQLLAYQKAECVYDITFYFAHKYLQKGDRTIDQMIQAARSGKQNIAEGSAAASTSSETELKLMNVAKASLHELLVDYEDYLRVRGLEQWQLNDKRTRAAQEFCSTHNTSSEYMAIIEPRTDEPAANIAITLIHQTDVMLRRLIERLEKDFVEQGGIRERMTAARLGYRQGQKTEIANLKQENERLKTRIAWLEAQLANATAPQQPPPPRQ